jgi:hypothetical protein
MVANTTSRSRQLQPIVALVVALCFASCATRKQSNTVETVGAVTMGGGAVIGFTALALARSQESETEAFSIGFNGLAVAGVVFGIGALLFVSGLVGSSVLPPDPPAR